MLEAAKKKVNTYGWKTAAEEERQVCFCHPAGSKSSNLLAAAEGCRAHYHRLPGCQPTAGRRHRVQGHHRDFRRVAVCWLLFYLINSLTTTPRSSGKTQLCHTLCVTTQLPLEDGGGAGKVVRWWVVHNRRTATASCAQAYMDTEGTFRPERIRPIADRFNLEADAVLDNVRCLSPPIEKTTSQQRSYLDSSTHTHTQNRLSSCVPTPLTTRWVRHLVLVWPQRTPPRTDLLTPLTAMMSEEPFKLLIIDSITANLRVDYSGRGELAERQQRLGVMMNRLRKVRR